MASENIMPDLTITKDGVNIIVRNIRRSNKDPENVDCRAQVLYNGVSMEYTLFTKKEGKDWQGWFEYRKWTGSDQKTKYTPRAMIIDPITKDTDGRSMYFYTRKIEDEVARAIAINFESDEDTETTEETTEESVGSPVEEAAAAVQAGETKPFANENTSEEKPEEVKATS